LTPARQVSGKWLFVLSLVAIIVSVVFVGYAFKALAPASNGTLFGSFFINEGGYPNASASATASYNLTLTAQGGKGTVLFTLLSGTDLIQDHAPTITNYTIDANKISMVVNGHTVTIPWEDNDTIWNHRYNNNYVASWGAKATSAAVRGHVDPSAFGLPSKDYIEFRFAAQGGNPVRGF
jgi:hypothetical protein